MKMAILLGRAAALALVWVSVPASPDIPGRFVGEWATVIDQENRPLFPHWWRTMYPVVLTVTKEALSFEDQISVHVVKDENRVKLGGSNCEPLAFFDDELDAMIFPSCGICGGRKSEWEIPVFHRVFTDGDQLVGEVWQHKVMFRWRGTRLDAEKSSGHWRLREVRQVPAWFEENKASLFEVRDLLLPHGAIDAVRVGEPPIMKDGSVGPSAASKAAHAEAAAFLQRLGIPEVRVWRNGGEFQSMLFILWRQDVGATKHATVVHYRVSKSVRIKPHYGPNTSLSVPGWHAYKSWWSLTDPPR